MPSEVRFAVVKKDVERAGWVLDRVRGSHHTFRKPDGTSYTIPVHHGKVLPYYVREITKQIREAQS